MILESNNDKFIVKHSGPKQDEGYTKFHHGSIILSALCESLYSDFFILVGSSQAWRQRSVNWPGSVRSPLRWPGTFRSEKSQASSGPSALAIKKQRLRLNFESLRTKITTRVRAARGQVPRRAQRPRKSESKKKKEKQTALRSRLRSDPCQKSFANEAKSS